MPFLVNVFASAVIIGSVVMSILMLRMVRAEKNLLYKTAFSIMLSTVLILIITLLVLLISGLASAAENSAPAENAVAIEKSTVTCPTEFNIDDPAWVMREINSVPQEIHKLYVERVRVFSYVPDLNPEKLIFIGIKKLWNPDCVAKLGSYSSYDFADGKRVWGIIQTPGKTTFFLLQNNDSPLDLKTLLRSKPDVWQSGDRITGTFACENMKECNITFVLYKENAPIAVRVLLINTLIK